MNRRLFLLALCLALGPIAGERALSAQEGFRVVVHASNPLDVIEKMKLERLFLKKESRWADNSKVQPVDRDANAAPRIAFSRIVLAKEVSWIKSYWQRQLFSGRDTPPLELDSDRDVLEYVAKNPGAIGYISPSTPLGAGVKVLRVN